ncbi:hypothetical protein Cgig2_015893 [Carnegiea gigantea]|uniref:Zinc knuckle CX2CX4HX4C domain-containing protein n=1 Tax=Carnegiea gigantea TaxID=171969 RepID=A0A9Q1GRU8_9CARY|nr:hypothetical protein Cgig2_015893 [Carnegiea gigantea]
MTGLERPSEVQFSKARFWVKAYDVPGKKQTTSFAHLLASNIGDFVSCNEATMFGVDKAVCFRADTDISKPLRKGIGVTVAGETMWIRFKFVKLPDSCYGCGRLVRTLKDCEIVVAEDDDPDLHYSAWLHASSLKFQRCNAEAELLEEKRLFMARGSIQAKARGWPLAEER